MLRESGFNVVLWQAGWITRSGARILATRHLLLQVAKTLNFVVVREWCESILHGYRVVVLHNDNNNNNNDDDDNNNNIRRDDDDARGERRQSLCLPPSLPPGLSTQATNLNAS